MGNKGSTIRVGEMMFEGDYLESDDGLSRLTLEGDGSLNLYWMPKLPGGIGAPYKVWQSGNSDQGPHYVVMQADGNLCCYYGIPSDPGPLRWQSGVAPGPGPAYYAVLQTDSNFCVYPNAAGQSTWCAGCARHVAGIIAIRALCTDSPQQVITSIPPSGGPANAASTQIGNIRADKRHQFYQTDLVVNNQPYGMLLTNVHNGLMLSAKPATYSPVEFTDTISNDSILIKVDPGPIPPWPDVTVAIRPLSGDNNHFNIPGDGPYNPGSTVIMYPWSRPAPSNFLFTFDTVGAAAVAGV